MRVSIISAAMAVTSLAAAQDFIVNRNASNLLSCRGSQLRNDYCCFDGIFSGPAWTSDDSITIVRKSLLTVRQVKKRFEKRDIVTEMAPGLTCSGFAAITLTNEDASALLASATSAADGEGASESDDIASTSAGGSQGVNSTGSQTGEMPVSTTMTSTSATSAGGGSASVTSSSTNGGVAMATQMPLLVVGGVVGLMGYAL